MVTPPASIAHRINATAGYLTGITAGGRVRFWISFETEDLPTSDERWGGPHHYWCNTLTDTGTLTEEGWTSVDDFYTELERQHDRFRGRIVFDYSTDPDTVASANERIEEYLDSQLAVQRRPGRGIVVS